MFKVFLDISGVDFAGNPRDFFKRSSRARMASKHGLDRLRVDDQRLAELRDKHADYCWFAIVRNPHSRAISNYANKLNRLAKRFCRPVYLAARLRCLAAGPSAWFDQAYAIEQMQKGIDFDQYLEILCERGVNFDAHYFPQAYHLRRDTIAYHQLLKMETLDSDLAALLDSWTSGEYRLKSLPRENASRKLGSTFRLTVEQRDKIYRLYEVDFQAFDYPR